MGLIAANGVFAGAEIAIVSVRRTRVSQLVDEGVAGAAVLAQLRATPERFLATVQIGITVVGTTAAAFGGSSLAERLAPVLVNVPGVGADAEQIALGIVVAGISYLSLVLGELVPKSLALRTAERYALLVALPIRWLSTLTRPFVWLLTASSNLILRPFSDRTNFVEARVSLEELQELVEEAGEAGTVHEQASELASRALEFPKLTFAQVMIPRNRMDALPLDAAPDRIRRFMLEERRSRVPIFAGTFDNVVGYVSAKDIVSLALEGRTIVLSNLLRPLKLFPETVPAIEVLRHMRRERQRLAVAVDEHGAVSGLLTFEDLVEELVGEVFSETEEDVEPLVKESEGSFLVRGDAKVRDLNRELSLEWEEGEGTTTVGGLATKLASGIPNRGARLAAEDGWVMEVVDASARAVRRVRLTPPPRSEEASEDDEV
ncbi:MAG: hemolysin family protein [Myxococcales bacterium]|nr:hemolysin family protein [Myxococcales bacterium]